MFKLIINEVTKGDTVVSLEFQTWEELQLYLYSLDRPANKKKKKETKSTSNRRSISVQTENSFRIVFD